MGGEEVVGLQSAVRSVRVFVSELVGDQISIWPASHVSDSPRTAAHFGHCRFQPQMEMRCHGNNGSKWPALRVWGGMGKYHTAEWVLPTMPPLKSEPRASSEVRTDASDRKRPAVRSLRVPRGDISTTGGGNGDVISGNASAARDPSRRLHLIARDRSVTGCTARFGRLRPAHSSHLTR
ncbi:hypothetical protein Bbelb_058670 [Branchiostoma belcheri]|nr:hypothetical protein Bbelb_058670 [Branchiostoma belcheri]